MEVPRVAKSYFGRQRTIMVVQFRVFAVTLVFITASQTGSIVALPTGCKCSSLKLHSTVGVRPDSSEITNGVGATFEVYCSESRRLEPALQSTTVVRCTEDCTWSQNVSGVKCVERQCPKIEEGDLPRNVTLRYKNTASGLLECGALAVFDCPDGYDRHGGPKFWECECNGNWNSNTFPECTAKNCEALSSPANAFCHSTSEINSLGTIRECSCDPGFYSEDGNGIFVCDIVDNDGNVDWIGHLHCSIGPDFGQCPKPRSSDNSIMMASTSGNGYPVGTAIKYACLPGTVIVGSNVVLCNDSWQWFPDPPKCVVAECRYSAPRDRVVRVMGDKKTRYRYKSRQWYACPPGYQLLGSSMRQCIGVDQWSGYEPKCKRLCPDPGIPVDGARSIHGLFYEGSKIVYQCGRGRLLNGSRQITCQANGRWTDSLPSCRHVECLKPTVTDSLVKQRTPSYYSYWHNAVIHYACPRGHEIKGSKSRKCLKGNWSGSEPSCKKS